MGKKIVCLGGGIGTVQLLKGLRNISNIDITVVASMADDGGSGGRLRRLYSIPPPGDLMNCLEALSEADSTIRKLLTYRFKGDRWGRDDSLVGQKLGNLILVALSSLNGRFLKGLEEAESLFKCRGKIYPATIENVSIWAETMTGKKVHGEEIIDRGLYEDADKGLSFVHLKPSRTITPKDVLEALSNANLVVIGPGDLYTTLLPVLLVVNINKLLKSIKAKKVFIINIANKPFETPNYAVSDFIEAIQRHIKYLPFDYILVNSNYKNILPKNLNYTYVKLDKKAKMFYNSKIILKDVVNKDFPLYHDPKKTINALLRHL